MAENYQHEALNVDEFNNGIRDHDSDIEPPRVSSESYDRGRALAARIPPCCRDDKNYKVFIALGRCPHGSVSEQEPKRD